MWSRSIPVALPLKPAVPFHGARKDPSVVSHKLNTPYSSKLQLPNIPTSQTQTLLSSSSSVTLQPFRALRIRPSPELGLASLLFVLSTAFAALLSLAIFSIPTTKSLRKLAASMEKLSDVVSQEVPGTLLSLKLSGLEVNDLTKQLSSIR
ncbi:uncharacterized protein LOC126792876 isoform X2 [Argentina anserina]|nr:uncharacterized protein LOC126792876 isoform X2 [Potentilla anserina]